MLLRYFVLLLSLFVGSRVLQPSYWKRKKWLFVLNCFNNVFLMPCDCKCFVTCSWCHMLACNFVIVVVPCHTHPLWSLFQCLHTLDVTAKIPLVPWGGLQCVMVVFSDHTRLLSRPKNSLVGRVEC